MLGKIKKVFRPEAPHRFEHLYEKFNSFTMIPKELYLANLELVDQYKEVKGAIVECGTWKGGMIAGVSSIVGPDRDYYLYDSYEGLPDATSIDGQAALEWQKNTDSPDYFDNCTASEQDAANAMARAGVSNPNIVKGWFENTLPSASFPDGIAILRMDADWYESTMQILDSLFPFLNEGGLLLVDDYYTWDGCSKAVHEYLAKHQRSERIGSHKGVCFIRKRPDEAPGVEK